LPWATPEPRIGATDRRAGPGVEPARPDSQAGIGYSAAFSTQPGFSEKSSRGGQKMSTSWLVPAPTALFVWMAGGGITVTYGDPQSS